MAIGLITGSGTYSAPGAEVEPETLDTRFGAAEVARSQLAGVEVLHVSRHGAGHRRLSNHVDHRAQIAALSDLGASAVLAVTVCGAVDPDLPLGSLVVFDDLHFPSNRLSDGSLSTLHDEPGRPGRGHWIFERPFSPELRAALLTGAAQAGAEARDGGCYGHVDGPRFNTRSEIAALAAFGVTAVSQTAGPETVLAGEAELPYALLGYATDYANGVKPEPTPADELARLIGASSAVFASVLTAALPLAEAASAAPTGVHFRFD